MNVQFNDGTGTALANDSLPSAPPVFADFEIRNFYVLGSGPGGASSDHCIHADITSLGAVPEPAMTAALSAIAAAGVGRWQIARRNSSHPNPRAAPQGTCRARR